MTEDGLKGKNARMIVYFDTNVFDHLERRSCGVTEWDLYRLRRAVRHKYCRVVLSFLTIEETLFFIQRDPVHAEAQIKLMLELGDKQLFALGQEMIINNEIRAYSHGTPSLPAFISMGVWTEFKIRNFAKPTGDYLTELQDLIEEVRRDKIVLQALLDKAKADVKPIADKIGVKRCPFGLYWAQNSGWLAEGLARQARVLSKVKRRGVDGLLKVKSVAAAVGGILSLIYSHHLENRPPNRGDSRDVMHTIVASTADVFVTNDGRLERILSRIPVDGFRVMDLRAFLESLPLWI